VVSVQCRLASGAVVEAQTLRAAPAALHVGRQAAPSARYLGLLLEGARHHGLPADYVHWLESQAAYSASSTAGLAVSAGLLLGSAAVIMPWAVAASAYRGARGASGGEGGVRGVVFDGVASTLHEATRLTWALHDSALAPWLGSGSHPAPGRAPGRQLQPSADGKL
jgi:hypothetical protein